MNTYVTQYECYFILHVSVFFLNQLSTMCNFGMLLPA